MGKEIIHLKPAAIWKHFYDITQIPRPSGHEQGMIDHLKQFAIQQKLEYSIDEIGNVLIKKPATTGHEKAQCIVLQSHVDMVPQKNSDKKHDFTKDPIETIIDGEWLRANNTTLGSDNGIGVAAMMGILESKDIVHGPIEALFTVTEETGMDGAFGLKPGWLKGSILINLDSEDEGELFIGCAGGLNFSATLPYNDENAPEGITYTLKISGLKGGHSGVDIHLGRGNSNKILGRFLWSALSKFQLRIANLRGGDLRNAIPREVNALIVVPKNQDADFKKFFEGYAIAIKNELKITEPGITLELISTEKPLKVITIADTQKIAGMLCAAPNGVIRMSDEMPGVVETSLNLAIASVNDNKASMFYLLRSSVDTAKYALLEQVTAYHQLLGCETESTGDYPGWRPDSKSTILKNATEAYNQIFGKTPGVTAIHAGLECGIIGGSHPGLDMISFGPTIRFPHSPDEKVNIASVQRFWDFLKGILEKSN